MHFTQHIPSLQPVPPNSPLPKHHSLSPLSLYSPPVNITVGYRHDPNVKHRPSMEDTVTIHPSPSFPGLFVAVYDGHGGTTASAYLQQLFHRLFLHQLLGDDLCHESPSVLSSKGTPKFRPLDDDGHSTCSTPPSDDHHDHNEHHHDSPSHDDAMSLPSDSPRSVTSFQPYHHANTEHLDVNAAFVRAYEQMDTVLRFRNCVRVGATAVTAFVRRVPGFGRILNVANCGDSRAVLCRAGRPVALTCQHKPVGEERDRIENSGGFVVHERVNGILNVSRAFGDHCMKSVVICRPAVTQIVLNHLDDFVVLACDGLWDFVSDVDVVRIAQRAFDHGCSPEGVAQRLVDEAIKRKSTDNVSVVVLNFNVEDE